MRDTSHNAWYQNYQLIFLLVGVPIFYWLIENHLLQK